MKAFLNWLDHRTGYREFVHEALYERIPGGSRWRYVWGSTLVFTFTVQVITGVFLWMCYSPSAQTAWESVYYLQYETSGGWLLRGLHHFTAQAMIVLMGLHLMQVVIDGAYRAPREVNFWLGLILMQIVLGLSLTGYLLPWDQKGYWATRVATNLLSVVPVVGPRLQQLVVGGADYGHQTLTRFFALHAGVLPGLFVLFLVLHVALFRRHGICAKQPFKAKDATFWPDQVLKDAVACLAVLVVVLVLVMRPMHVFMADHPVSAAELGAELGAPADSSNQYSAARPEWYFLFLFQFLKLFDGQGERGELLGAVVIPGLVMLALFLMPLIGRWNLGHRFNLGFLAILFAGIVFLTGSATVEDYRAKITDSSKFAKVAEILEADGDDPENIAAYFDGDKAKIEQFHSHVADYQKYRKSQGYIEAVKQAEREAERVVTLASAPSRIPLTGALTLLRSDPKTQGPRIFATHCASCHTDSPQVADGGTPEGIRRESSAPNLNQFASRAWIAGLLDPKRVAGHDYFGNTSHKEGSMVDFVTNSLTDWSAEDVQSVVMALSAEAGLRSQQLEDERDQERIEAGRKLIANDEKCASCHKFHDAGELGAAPDLTGYGSRDWLMGMIASPENERFYVGNNDRMPTFAQQPGDSPQNRISQQTLRLIVDWLRGEWYEPAAAVEAGPTKVLAKTVDVTPMNGSPHAASESVPPKISGE